MKEIISLRASSLPGFMACPASELNPDKLTEVIVDGEGAELGTLVHEFAQRVVQTGEVDLTELTSRCPSSVDRASLLIKNFKALWREARKTITKPVCELSLESVIHDTDSQQIRLTGHIDVCHIEPDRAFLLDYKTGYGREDHTYQVAGYAYLLWDYVGRPDDFSVYAAVAYLEDLTVVNYVFSSALIRKTRDDIIRQADPARRKYVVNRRCAFCKLQNSCPSLREYNRGTLAFLSSEEAQRGRIKWTEMTPEERGNLIDRLYIVKRAIDRIEKSLRAVTLSRPGQTLDIGGGMVYSRSTRKRHVLNVQKALPVLRRRFTQKQLDTITQIDWGDLMSLARKYCPRKGKVGSLQQLMDTLDRNGAIEELETGTFGRRSAKQEQLSVEENEHERDI